MEINILGVPYGIELERVANADPKLKDAYGYAELYSKEIVIEDVISTMVDEPQLVRDPDKFIKTILRHEITHAMFHESGHKDWCNDEKLVDWIALMGEKLIEAWSQAGALDSIELKKVGE